MEDKDESSRMIDWVVKESDAHIISSFEDENNLIDGGRQRR